MLHQSLGQNPYMRVEVFSDTPNQHHHRAHHRHQNHRQHHRHHKSTTEAPVNNDDVPNTQDDNIDSSKNLEKRANQADEPAQQPMMQSQRQVENGLVGATFANQP